MTKIFNPPLQTVAYRIPEMAPPPPHALRDPAEAADLAAELGRSLQLSRASALALTRLQLAMKSGDRHAAMAALDRLHTLDEEMERLAAELPRPVPSPRQDALHRHVTDQKLALAFEKLALASEISGPGMASANRPGRRPEEFHPSAEPADPLVTERAVHDDPPPLAQWPRSPEPQALEWKALPIWLLGLFAAMLAMVAVGAAVFAMAGG